MNIDEKRMVENYDQKASATEWLGPEVAFRLACKYIKPGQTMLDIGIGTGLGAYQFYKAGLIVSGMDISGEMLDTCRKKGFASDLKKHDLKITPYPYEKASMNLVLCIGVMQFFKDLSKIFREVNRILRDNGLFVFIVANRGPNEKSEVVVRPKHTGTNEPVIMVLHSTEQINQWLADSAFQFVQGLEFTVYMDHEKSAKLPAKAYLAKKIRIRE